MQRRKLQLTKVIVPDYVGGPALQWGLYLDTLTCSKSVYLRAVTARFLWVWNSAEF